jgi:hypothetical protein
LQGVPRNKGANARAERASFKFPSLPAGRNLSAEETPAARFRWL